MTALPIQLPRGFLSRLKSGDRVAVGDLLAEFISHNDVLVNVAHELALPVAKTRKVLKKNPGDRVSVGDTLALKKGLLSLSKTEVVSNVSGTVLRYERHTGNLAIRTGNTQQTQKLLSPVEGTIALCDNEQIVIHTDKNAFQGNSGIGARATGEVALLDASFSENTQANLLYYLDSNAIGKIVVGNLFTREMLPKGIGLGVKGLIAGMIAEPDLAYLATRTQQTPVVTVGLPVLDKLQLWKGRNVFLDGNAKSVIFLQ